ncbi:MAG: hypothetical protein ACAI38_02100, partial [Myxococcota bacterium]
MFDKLTKWINNVAANGAATGAPETPRAETAQPGRTPAAAATKDELAPVDREALAARPARQAERAAVEDGHASAAAAQFSARFPGVTFEGTPDMSKIDPEVRIAPGATIKFPDPKQGSLELR